MPSTDYHPPPVFSAVRIVSLLSSLLVALASGTNYVSSHLFREDQRSKRAMTWSRSSPVLAVQTQLVEHELMSVPYI